MRSARPTRPLYHALGGSTNVTPLVDVMLVLLIVFMITAPMLAAGMRVELPQAKSAQAVEPKEPVIVTVQKDGKMFLGRDELAPGQLGEALRVKLGADKERAIHLRGDRDAAYGQIVSVIDQLKAGGFAKVTLIANAGIAQQASPPASN